MHIKITNGANRRAAYTDRKDGYFEYFFGSDAKENGYHRGNVQYFRGFSCQGHSLLEAQSVRVYPQGFRAVFEKSSLDVSLLVDEQAFYIASDRNAGLIGAVPVKTIEQRIQNSESGLEDAQVEYETVEVRAVPNWHSQKKDDVTVLSSDTGIAIAADFDFYHAVNDDDLELIVADGKSLGISDKAFENTGWYVVFEADEATAIEKAFRLVKEKGIERHKAVINDFIANASFDCGDKKFNEAVVWARFSAWMLATKDQGSEHRGIWAGLPWFRDNWGRDTFISLCGTLLASGCFDEAKDVLLGFAGFQDIYQGSVSYGRIPNRYRNANDVIYNTADGTLWFIRALWEYVQYSGDTAILEQLRKTVETALDADCMRCDDHGFLMHGDADTWMDARIAGKEPLSPRGNRANDVQALWFTALKIGEKIENHFGNHEKAQKYAALAKNVKKSFIEFFWNADCNALADRLPEGGYGEWAKDMRVRPNQLFTIMVPSILDKEEELSAPEVKASALRAGKTDAHDGRNLFIGTQIASHVLQNVRRELVSPFGLFSLSPEDPLFHPEHENPEWYHKDAAYHNGTIWEWNTGAYITSEAQNSQGVLPDFASAILRNEAKMILDAGCVGSLSENIHARTDEYGNPKLSGTFSQAWSVAEFVRNLFQDVAGFRPALLKKEVHFAPCLPASLNELSVSVPFGNGWHMDIQIKRLGKVYKSKLEWVCPKNSEPDYTLSVCGTSLSPNAKIEVDTPAVSENHKALIAEKFGVPAKWLTKGFAPHKLDNEFCGAEHIENYLQNLIRSGRMQSRTSGGENTAALEWYFDSADFKRNYLTNIELGAIYSKHKTVFRLWAPTAKAVSLHLYKDGENSAAYKTLALRLRANGVWEAEEKGDLHGVYYLYTVLVHGVEQSSADPYAKACGVNGNRSMVVDLERTNPSGWQKCAAPVIKTPADVIAYEAHVADITSSPSWNGPENLRRTFLGAATEGTSLHGNPTGFDYIKSLGVTHVQLLPIFDFRSVNEANVTKEEVKNRITFGAFNWGYDPQNYACLEGSYSTNPFDGAVRIKEFKTMVQSYARAGIGIIMDVVYNHVNDGLHQALGTSVPGYFFRVEGYSGAGEDTASEREMFRKYMIDTLSFWLREYKLCGFRFDLMGLHDTETMNAIRTALRKIKHDVLIYGEGWDMYRAGKMLGASQVNAAKMPEIGFFNDAVRCAIKGPVFDDKMPGYVHNGSRREAVKFGIVGATKHSQVHNDKVEGTANPNPWSLKTWVSVNYTEIHDNMTCYDKLFMVEQNQPEEWRDQLQKMAISLVLLSQGYPILHAGMEFCRTKEIPAEIIAKNPVIYDVATSDNGERRFCRNTYNVCDQINALDWQRSILKQDVVEYVRNLIAVRKAHPAFRLATAAQTNDALRFIDNKKANLAESVIAWELNGARCKDTWKKILVVANPECAEITCELPGKDDWALVTDGRRFCDLSQKPTSDQKLGGGSTVHIQPKCVAIYATM